MAVYKVEICGVNTSKLPLLTEEEKKELLKDIEEYDDLKIFPERYFQPILISFSHMSLFYVNKIFFAVYVFFFYKITGCPT